LDALTSAHGLDHEVQRILAAHDALGGVVMATIVRRQPPASGVPIASSPAHLSAVDSFAFVGIGGLTAITFLAVAYAAFAALASAIGAAADGVRLSVVPAVVDGLRDWRRAVPMNEPGGSSPGPQAPWEELSPGGDEVPPAARVVGSG
jgi:hypothetical protein